METNKVVRKVFLLFVIFSVGCGSIAPNRPPLDNNMAIIQAAHQVAERVYGRPIQMDEIRIWEVGYDDNPCESSHSIGCEQEGDIVLLNHEILDVDNWCMVLAHELIHAGEHQTGYRNGCNHNAVMFKPCEPDQYDFAAVLGAPECVAITSFD